MGNAIRETNSPRPAPRLRPALLAAIAAVAVLGALGVASSGAQSIDDLNSRIAGARDQAEALGAEIEQATAALADAQGQALAAAQREAQLNQVLARGEEREAQLESAVDEAEAALAKARDDLQRSLNALGDRLVQIYRGDMPDTMTLLLESEGFDDLATRSTYLTRIEEADAALVTRVRSERDSVEVQLAAVENAEAAVQAQNERVAAARDQMSAVRAEAEARAAELAAARDARAAAVEALQSKIGGWTDEVAKMERISEQQATEEVGQWLGGGDYVIPESIVMCESGGNWEAVNPSSGAGGAYQILPSTWELYGGEGNPEDASPAEQSDIAAQIWADSGSAAWVCAG